MSEGSTDKGFQFIYVARHVNINHNSYWMNFWVAHCHLDVMDGSMLYIVYHHSKDLHEKVWGQRVPMSQTLNRFKMLVGDSFRIIVGDSFRIIEKCILHCGYALVNHNSPFGQIVQTDP